MRWVGSRTVAVVARSHPWNFHAWRLMKAPPLREGERLDFALRAGCSCQYRSVAVVELPAEQLHRPGMVGP